ncbi:MAG TPA: hypothetical protein VIY53_01950 [Acidobacteriaceae bacterium]
MVPKNLRYGGGALDSAISPVVAVYLLIAIVLILTLPRNKVITPFLLAFFTIPVGEVLVLGGFHFTALRVLILTGLARRLTFGKGRDAGKFPGGFSRIDWMVIAWATAAGVAQCLEFMNQAAVVNASGDLVDTLGGYLVVRSLITDGDAVRRTIKTMALLCVILGACMVYEQVGHINVFGLMGGISREVTVRNGKIRSGATLGCLYAGAFSGVLIPVFLWLWTQRRCKLIAVAGIVGATAMVATSNSSTSWLAYVGSFIGLALWPLRRQMRLVRYGIVAALIGLQMVMKAPVWALIARIDLTGSSSGEQRYMLVDMTMKHIPAWWLIGTPSYVNWGWDSWDLCNQFVAVALTGGLLTLIFYIGIFSRGFGSLGKAIKRIRGPRRQEWLLWAFGSSLFATVVAHFGINYMAQLIMGFFPLVACISVVVSEARRPAVRLAEATAAAPAGSPALATAVVSGCTGSGQDPLHQASEQKTARSRSLIRA